MNPALHDLLDDFTRRHAGLRLVTDEHGRTVLLCDEQRVVNLIDEPHSGMVWALATAGRLAPPQHETTAPPEYGEEWISHTREVDGFEWSVSCNVASRVIALAAKAPWSSLDLPGFHAWMSAFLDRLRATSAVFPISAP